MAERKRAEEKEREEDLKALKNVLRRLKEGYPFIVDAYVPPDGTPVIEMSLEKAFKREVN